MFGSISAASPPILFNGVPAPILYAGLNQVNAIVPFGLDLSIQLKLKSGRRNRITDSRALEALHSGWAVAADIYDWYRNTRSSRSLAPCCMPPKWEASSLGWTEGLGIIVHHENDLSDCRRGSSRLVLAHMVRRKTSVRQVESDLRPE